MRLIESVEISYFRSLYKAHLNPAGDLTILFGRNDSGKSNFLRALNLFFNYESDLDREPDFDIDFSDTRRVEAQRGSSRQFFSVRVYFNVPPNYRKSLGDSIWIKRQWNRDGEVTDTYPRGVTKGQKIQITKFLGTIDYTYVPAIKDVETFSRLVRRMYDAAAESKALAAATGQFINSIRSATNELSSSLALTLGAPASLAAPNDMGDLFKSLDFSHGDDNHSLLLQKGDGIKARHIPELLRYINQNESTYKSFIWGFEEPENSLDLGAAVSEANRFAEFAARGDTQIFVTSHSPAFYLSGSSNSSTLVRRAFVSKQGRVGDRVAPPQAIRSIDTVDLAESVMGDASLHELPYVIRKMSDLQTDKELLVQQAEALRNQLKEIKRPCVFVEGESEVSCLSPLIKAVNDQAIVKKLKGTPSTTAELLKKVYSDGGGISNTKTVFLFDFDNAGRNAFSNLTGVSDYKTPFSLTDNISALCLPTTEEFELFLKNHEIPLERCFFPLEFVFDGVAAASILYELMTPAQKDEAKYRIREEYHNSLPQRISHALRSADGGTAEWFWSRGVPNALKSDFFKRLKSNKVNSRLPELINILAARL